MVGHRAADDPQRALSEARRLAGAILERYRSLDDDALLLLFSGAYFPPDILPPVLKEITMAMPITYWLEGMRRALSGGILTATYPGGKSGPISPLLAQFNDWQLLLIVLGSAVVSAAVSYLFFRWVEGQAKERGMIDRLTGY